MEEPLPGPLGRHGRRAPELRARIQEALKKVIDPETGLDVLRMGLVRSIRLERRKAGYEVLLIFRPTSPVCPLAFKLAWDIKRTVRGVDPKIESVEVQVEGYDRAEELETILKEDPGKEPDMSPGGDAPTQTDRRKEKP